MAGTDADLVSPARGVPQVESGDAAEVLPRRLQSRPLGRERVAQFDFAALGKLVREVSWGGWLIVEVNRREDVPSRTLVEEARGLVRRGFGA